MPINCLNRTRVSPKLKASVPSLEVHVRQRVRLPQTPLSGCLKDCNTVVLNILYVHMERVHDPVCDVDQMARVSHTFNTGLSGGSLQWFKCF